MNRPSRTKKKNRSTKLQFEALESREVPATLVSPSAVTYQDADGDKVTVSFSKPILTQAVANAFFTFDTGMVNDDNSMKQQLKSLKLGGVAENVNVTVKATAANGGDGFAHIGQIDADGTDIGVVTVDGDLARISAGDADPNTTALKGLAVQSMGRFGLSTGATFWLSQIKGDLGFLKVKGDFDEAWLQVNGNLKSIDIGGSILGSPLDVSGYIITLGSIGTVKVKGDIVGGGGTYSGYLGSMDKIGSVRIGGSIIGGSNHDSGVVAATNGIGAVKVMGNVAGGTGDSSGKIRSGGGMASVVIGGSILGGDGFDSGIVRSTTNMGPVRIGGNISGGSGKHTGEVFSEGKLASVTVGGSVVGGNNEYTGKIFAVGDVGPVTIKGNIVGNANYTAEVYTNGKLKSVSIGGSLIGGDGVNSGWIRAAGELGSLKIAGDLVGGSASGNADLFQSGYVVAQRIGNVTIGGSIISGVDDTTGNFVNNGAIRAGDDLGTVTVKKNLVGNPTNPVVISGRGQAKPTGNRDVAIGKLTVLGRTEFAEILAGVDASGTAMNADAQIGNVFVGGDWIATSMAAGAVRGLFGFGTVQDAKMSGMGVKDEAGVMSKIASVTIGGLALGTTDSVFDHYGIVTEQIGQVKIGGSSLPNAVGMNKDNLPVGLTNDFKVHEI